MKAATTPLTNHKKNPQPRFNRNQQYSITALTDGGGTIVERYAYTAYGQVTILDTSLSPLATSAAGNRYTYTGREWDKTLSLDHYRARMYDAVAGRFSSRDPIGHVDGPSTYFAYFVIYKLDPSGTQEIGVPPWPPLINEVPMQVGTGGKANATGLPKPYRPGDGGVNVDIWGEGNQQGFVDLATAGAPGLHIYQGPRALTDTIPDRTVDVVAIRKSPIRGIELDEICRICKDGCTITFARRGERGAPYSIRDLYESELFEEHFGDRFGGMTNPPMRPIVFADTDPPIYIYVLSVRLKKGTCPCEKQKSQRRFKHRRVF